MDTPISVLQDFCFRHLDGVNPDYQLMSVEGVVHSPTFIYRVQIDDIVASSVGNSKKKAKHGAAMSALETLVGRYKHVHNLDYFISKIASFKEENPVKKDTTEEMMVDSDANPVGKLQEICMKKRWRPPIYETTEEIGLPHERIFTMTCDIEHAEMKLGVVGRGKSKKQAKRSAAQEMIVKLEELNIHHSSSHENARQSERIFEKTVQNHLHSEGIHKNVLKSTTLFYQDLDEGLNRTLDSFLPTDESTSVDACENLSTVADYVECATKYVTYDALNPVEQLCLASLVPRDSYKHPFPLVTGWGRGETVECAKQSAALKTLQLFKSMRNFTDIQ